MECRRIEGEAAMSDFKDSHSKRAKSEKKLVLITGIVVALLLVVYIGFALYFGNRFYFGSVINGQKVAGKTVEQVEEQLSDDVANYKLKLMEKRGGITESISAKEIALKFISDGKVKELKEKQNSFAWPLAVFGSADYDMSASLKYDEAKLKEAFDKLECFKKENIKKPRNAYPKYKDGAYVIVEEDYGNYVQKDKLFELVKKAIEQGDESIDFEKAKCYQDPEYKKDSKEIIDAAKVMNDYIGVTITYEFGEATETVNAEQIHTWLSLNDKHEVIFDEEKVRECVNGIAREHDTFGQRRAFKTSTDHNLTIVGGDYGFLMDRAQEVQELIKTVKEGKSGKREPVYRQKANQYGADDIGNTYVEVNLTKQHLWFYFKGKLIVESDFVSGNPSRGNETPTGTYSITYKERNATLNGENYSTPVQYWMPFNGNIGLHDAGWRHGRFGGKIYLHNGSHGCVNLPPDVAKTIYGYVEKGMPVVCYQE